MTAPVYLDPPFNSRPAQRRGPSVGGAGVVHGWLSEARWFQFQMGG